MSRRRVSPTGGTCPSAATGPIIPLCGPSLNRVITLTLVQAGHVFRSRSNFALRHAKRNARHDTVIVDSPIRFEIDQLPLGIRRILPGYTGETRRNSVSGRPMAAHARWDARFSVPSAIQAPARKGKLLVRSGSRSQCLAREVRSEIPHVLLFKRSCHALHDRVIARAGLERLKLRQEILRNLTGEPGPGQVGATVAVHAV